MVKRRIFENVELRRTLVALERAGRKKKIWKAVADIIARPRRIRVAVNLSKISKLCAEGSTVIVPGKVLGAGIIGKKLTVMSFGMSESARRKIEAAGGKTLALAPENIGDKVLNKPIIIC